IKNGTADKLVEKLNEKLKESGSDLRFTLDNHADTKYNPDNVETTINLYDSKTGNKVDLFGAAQPKNQLEKQYGDLNGSKDAGFNPEQNVAGYEKGPMNEKEVAETAQRIAEAIQNGKDGQKLDVTYLLMQAERRGSLEAVVKALNDGFKEKGLDIHVGLQKEKMLSTLPHGEKWDDPLNTFNNYNIRVFDGSGKQLKDYPFSQSYYEKLTPEQKQQLFIESLRRR
ncbi:MAG: hypothetical protein K2Z81_10395, partial [Cyanobacteria bacterium]|nr:hypothetical protein [Cyanobacteriota bacterium]